MTILLHICCGPCATAIIRDLQQRGFTVTAFFYNPNIQPLTERARRFSSLQKHLDTIGVPLLSVKQEEQDFVSAIKNTPQRPERCRACYQLRLSATARAAADNNFDYFTTTLLSSPHQDINAIREIGEKQASRYQTEFYTPDSGNDAPSKPRDHRGVKGGHKKFKGFRPLFTASRQLAKQEHLYEQKYCGCLLSRAENSEIKNKE